MQVTKHYFGGAKGWLQNNCLGSCSVCRARLAQQTGSCLPHQCLHLDGVFPSCSRRATQYVHKEYSHTNKAILKKIILWKSNWENRFWNSRISSAGAATPKDSFTKWLQAYPSKSKTVHNVRMSIKEFLSPQQTAEHAYTDGSAE